MKQMRKITSVGALRNGVIAVFRINGIKPKKPRRVERPFDLVKDR